MTYLGDHMRVLKYYFLKLKELNRGIFNFIIMSLNTMFWCFPVFVFDFIKNVTKKSSIKRYCDKVVVFCSENWISVNSKVIAMTSNIEWDIKGIENLSDLKNYLIVSNHQSWVDIVVLQKILNKKVPFPRFFVKKQLRWLPLLGRAFKALDFPFMNRYSKSYLKKHPEKKGEDMKITQKACQKMALQRFSLINFLEGTRFTKKKYKEQRSPFKNHLRPKAGGLAFALEAFEGKINTLLDVTIVYSKENLTFWNYLTGSLRKIKVSIREIPVPNEFLGRSYVDDEQFRKVIQEWVNHIWEEKDKEYQKLLSC